MDHRSHRGGCWRGNGPLAALLSLPALLIYSRKKVDVVLSRASIRVCSIRMISKRHSKFSAY
ncbi:hypothetical protein CHELA1G11_20072 [Hyphomicrobiales bacterium]|nr:hypothetical protein CHELA1G11_20072 [Hyphomicrobiales bacterium]